jgi:protein-disulfide isomerase
MEPNTTTPPTNPLLVPLAIVVAGALIALAIYSGGTKKPTTYYQQENETIEVPAVSNQDHLLGNPDAPVTVIEYSDTECPFCKSFHNTLKTLIGSYNGQVAWVYRHFPIAQLHSKAPKEAEATECVAELGGEQIFWKYLDSIFTTTNSNDSLDPAQLPALAGSFGINTSAFNSCLSSGRYTDKIQKSIEEAVKIGARGTPYSVIVSKSGERVVVNGAEPIESVKTKIDSLLK